MIRQQILLQYMIKRFKHGKSHWSAKLKKKTNTEKALQHFDDFYGSVYGKRWGGIRAALLSERKYMALVNQFGDAEKTKEMLENGGAINVRRIYEAMQNEDLNPSYCATPSSETTGHGAKETKTELEKSLFEFVQKQKSTEIETLYEKDIEEGLNKLKDDVEVDEKRVLPPLDMSNFNRSLEATLTDASDLDLSRMISSEIGFAGLQEFIPATKLKGMEDFVPESQHYKYYSTTVDFPIETELETKFPFPSNVEVYTYERGNVSRFRRPIKSETGVLTHFLMDGASILPPLFLDVQPGEKVYDACSAPGGKSLFLIQTLRPDVIVCNELQESRTKRIRNLMNQYVPAFDREWASSRCVIRRGDATRCDEYGLYDRVLVDVPCTTDRHSLAEDDNNIFRSDRIKERLRMPELQSDILINCMRLLKVGGTLVYSTCSLSPIQNDGVVNMALSKAFADFNITFTIKDLSHVIYPLRTIIRFENPKDLKYGQLVVPYLPANFGPMYICKMTRKT